MARDIINENINAIKKEIEESKTPKPKHGDIFKFMGGGHDYCLMESNYIKGGDFLVAWDTGTHVYPKGSVECFYKEGTWVRVGNVFDTN